MHTIDQIIAECITNGFAQVNMNKKNSGCTSEIALIFLYDSENDILLQSCRPIELWKTEGVLNLKVVVRMWLF